MHFCIGQYITEKGKRSTSHFVVEENRKRYEYYLGALKQWRRTTGQLQIVSDYQMSLYQMGRYEYLSVQLVPISYRFDREHSNTSDDALAAEHPVIPDRLFTL